MKIGRNYFWNLSNNSGGDLKKYDFNFKLAEMSPSPAL